jgi:ATP-dependent helicase/nuclease subunit B
MLKLLIGQDWVANRNEIFRQLADDVHNRKENRILLVPELISHAYERMLCTVAGDTASRYAEVLSFTRLVRRVSDYEGTAVFPCLDNGG